MTPQQKKVLTDAAKGKLKNEGILTAGSSTYINPIRKLKPQTPKTKKK